MYFNDKYISIYLLDVFTICYFLFSFQKNNCCKKLVFTIFPGQYQNQSSPWCSTLTQLLKPSRAELQIDGSAQDFRSSQQSLVPLLHTQQQQQQPTKLKYEDVLLKSRNDPIPIRCIHCFTLQTKMFTIKIKNGRAAPWKPGILDLQTNIE